jgi:activator of HSP90 ATPase
MTGNEGLSDPPGAPARRKIIAGMVLAFGGLAVGSSAAGGKPQQHMTEAQSTGAEALLTYLHQEVEIQAAPRRIYEALLDSKQFATFTGMPAEIDPKVGGALSMFKGLILGRNIELIANQRIVQAWRPGDWEPGVYSLVRFALTPQGSATRLVLDHTGFPEGSFRHLNSGWYERYWEPLKAFLT